MIWECTECRCRESTYVHPCRADTGVKNIAPVSCLLDPMGTEFKWRKVSERKATRRKLRSFSILSRKDITHNSRVCPDSWNKLCFVDPQIDKEAEELARKVELAVLGVQG
ncbi:hypothetical protein [uncultured Methanomethylovorans sp.]|uniref:hypothetical protein n=1 Tax=uncultured Methanomethylovorans sp. TaxID=183759 RepID=UPI002AA60669|nr:hypothetical protein [uncultured Methanomethylovorans sp.]